MAGLDYNILNGGKSLLDQAQLQQDFNLRKQAALQQLASGSVDAASKANALKYQLIAAGAANGSDGVAAAKNKLGQLGIDASEYSDDPTQAAAQALAAQKASSPYGTLFNADQKVIGNNIAATAAFGTTQNPFAQPLPVIPGQVAQPVTPPAPAVQPALARPTPSQAPVEPNSVAVPSQYIDMPNVPPTPPALPATQLNGQASLAIPQVGGFQFRAQTPDETAAKYNQERNAALDEYKLNNAAQIEQDKAKASEMGKNQAGAVKNALDSDQNYQKVSQTLDAIKQMAPDLPQKENLIGPDTRAAFNQNFGDGKMAANYSKFQTINEAQTLGAIQTLADTGQIRMTRTLENIINRGFLVDPNLNPQGKIDQANAIQAELRNAAVAPANVNASLNGGQQAQYSSPLTPPSPTIQGTPSLQQSFTNQKAAASGIAEGTTATNPQTGHKIIFKDGKWQDQ